ncbi:MAG: hypothetical protein JW914_02955 [Syntrophaceae bacterium]|nr:hypothetical protein [Syntrophaceae bacterium]
MKKIIFVVLTISISLLLIGAGPRSVSGPNRAPVAVAGMDKVVPRYATVFLDGSKSYDPDGDKITYEWQVIAAPQNTSPRIFAGQRTMKNCRFRSDILGQYLVALTVYDGKLASQRDVMQIRVQDPPGDPNATVNEQDVHIIAPVKIGKANLRPAPEGSKFIVAPDKFNMFVKFMNPLHAYFKTNASFIYDWTPIKADGENKKLFGFLLEIMGVQMITRNFGPFDSPKKKEFKTLAILREHEKGYDVLYTVQIKPDR